MATLREIAGRIEELSASEEALTIFVDGDSGVGPESEVSVIPESHAEGHRYLLECVIAKEVVEDWESVRGPIDADQRSRLIAHYAEFDAYPEGLK